MEGGGGEWGVRADSDFVSAGGDVVVSGEGGSDSASLAPAQPWTLPVAGASSIAVSHSCCLEAASHSCWAAVSHSSSVAAPPLSSGNPVSMATVSSSSGQGLPSSGVQGWVSPWRGARGTATPALCPVSWGPQVAWWPPGATSAGAAPEPGPAGSHTLLRAVLHPSPPPSALQGEVGGHSWWSPSPHITTCRGNGFSSTSPVSTSRFFSFFNFFLLALLAGGWLLSTAETSSPVTAASAGRVACPVFLAPGLRTATGVWEAVAEGWAGCPGGRCRPGEVTEVVDTRESRLVVDTRESLFDPARFTGTGRSVSRAGATMVEVLGEPTRKLRRDLPRSCTGLMIFERLEGACASLGAGVGAMVSPAANSSTASSSTVRSTTASCARVTEALAGPDTGVSSMTGVSSGSLGLPFATDFLLFCFFLAISALAQLLAMGAPTVRGGSWHRGGATVPHSSTAARAHTQIPVREKRSSHLLGFPPKDNA